MIGSPAFPFDKDEVLARAEETFDRGWSTGGVLRQMVAVMTQENRTQRLHALRIPALVVHGTADRMVHPSGGRATAAAIPGAELLLVDGLGHDLPADLYDTFVDAIRRTADRGAESSAERADLEPERFGRVERDFAQLTAAGQSERRSPVSVSKTCTFCGSVVT